MKHFGLTFQISWAFCPKCATENVCYGLIWFVYCLFRFVLMHLPGIKVKVRRRFLFLRNEKLPCQHLIPRHKKVKCHIHKTHYWTQAKSESEDDTIYFLRILRRWSSQWTRIRMGKLATQSSGFDEHAIFLFPSNEYDFVSRVLWLPGKGMMWCFHWYAWFTNNSKCQKLALLLLGDVGRLTFDHSRGGPPNCQSVRKSWMFLKVVSRKVQWKGVNGNG